MSLLQKARKCPGLQLNVINFRGYEFIVSDEFRFTFTFV